VPDPTGYVAQGALHPLVACGDGHNAQEGYFFAVTPAQNHDRWFAGHGARYLLGRQTARSQQRVDLHLALYLFRSEHA
jgi:hypothetical protein